jgi:hypothetical protein
LLVAVYFLPSFLVVAIGKGQLQNRHPKARQVICNITTIHGYEIENNFNVVK